MTAFTKRLTAEQEAELRKRLGETADGKRQTAAEAKYNPYAATARPVVVSAGQTAVTVPYKTPCGTCGR
jgi:uncharacterized membrane protein